MSQISPQMHRTGDPLVNGHPRSDIKVATAETLPPIGCARLNRAVCPSLHIPKIVPSSGDQIAYRMPWGGLVQKATSTFLQQRHLGRFGSDLRNRSVLGTLRNEMAYSFTALKTATRPLLITSDSNAADYSPSSHPVMRSGAFLGEMSVPEAWDRVGNCRRPLASNLLPAGGRAPAGRKQRVVNPW